MEPSSNMVKILLFTLEYPPFKGGVANYYGNVVKYWLEPDDIFVLNNNHNKLVKNWLWPKWLPAVRQLWQAVKKEKINYVLVGHVLPLGTIAWLLSYFLKFKYSVILHGMDFAYALHKARKKRTTKRILIKAQSIICANSYTAKLVENFLGKKQAGKVQVVNPGITPRKQKAKSKKQEILINKYNLQNKIILFSVGRLVKRKGFDMVIEAMMEVLKKVPDLVYLIAGAGPDEKSLKKKASSGTLASLPATIIFLGKITDEEKWAWLDLCDLFITVSRNIKGDFEGFGIVYLEANIAGKPVIAGDSGGVRDAVKDGVNGLLVNSEDAAEIAEAIIRLAKDRNLRKKLGEQGRERAIKEFNWEKQVGKIYSLIKD